MKKLVITFISALTVLALTSPLHAAEEMKTQQRENQARSMSAEDFQGMQVVSQEGEKIGEITKAHADQQSGQVQFVIVSQGETGREDVAVPLEAMQFDQEKDQATLKVAESKLENAPEQAEKSIQVFLFELEEHYGVAPAWQEEEAEIIGPPVSPVDVPGQQIDSQ